ncbi:hypothetical protein MRX96_011034 [Rhipicephalus microplus]
MSRILKEFWDYCQIGCIPSLPITQHKDERRNLGLYKRHYYEPPDVPLEPTQASTTSLGSWLHDLFVGYYTPFGIPPLNPMHLDHAAADDPHHGMTKQRTWANFAVSADGARGEVASDDVVALHADDVCRAVGTAVNIWKNMSADDSDSEVEHRTDQKTEKVEAELAVAFAKNKNKSADGRHVSRFEVA